MHDVREAASEPQSAMPADAPVSAASPLLQVSFVIVNYRIAAKVAEAVASIESYCDVAFETLVVDNSESADEAQTLRAMLRERAQVLVAPRNGGFGEGCNLGVQHARGVYVFFLNPDARLLTPCVRRLIAHMERDPTLGAIGGKLLYPDGQEGHSQGQFIGLRRPLQMLKGTLHGYVNRLRGQLPDKQPKHRLSQGLQEVDWCSGADLLLRRADFACVGGFDPAYFLYYEECDLQYRLRRRLGGRAAIDGEVGILHEDGGTGLASNEKRYLIEAGCLRFVDTHRSVPTRLVYRLLLWQALGVELAVSAMEADRPHSRATLHLLRRVSTWHRGVRDAPV